MDDDKLVEERNQLLESLRDANRRMIEEEKSKKRDNKLHGENSKAIKEEIEEILERLKGPGE
jgi:hypothetical protein